jgi:hypothetical protein
MKRVLLLIAGFFGGAIAVSLLPAEWRERLSRLPGALMGWTMEHMPDE